MKHSDQAVAVPLMAPKTFKFQVPFLRVFNGLLLRDFDFDIK
jgi:hypothetical protein